MNETVLVTGAGGGVGISIIKAAKKAGFHVIGADMNKLSAGPMLADSGCLLPAATAPNYADALVDMCNAKRVEAVIPGCDPELITLARLKPIIEAETDAKVIVGTLDAVSISRSKFDTQVFLRDHGFNYCETRRGEELVNSEEFNFPVIVKPDNGSGSVNLFKVQNGLELTHILLYLENRGIIPVIQEMLLPANQEYTTGIMFGEDKTFLGAIPLKRRIKKGASYRAWSGDYPQVYEEMVKIGKALDTSGPLNIQCRLTERGPTVFEINPRFSGTTCVRSELGFRDVKMVVEHYLHGTIPDIVDVTYQKDITIIRYLEEMYVNE